MSDRPYSTVHHFLCITSCASLPVQAMIQLMEEYTQGKYTPSQEAEHHNGDTSTAVKVDVRNEEEKTPLHLAAQRGHLE